MFWPAWLKWRRGKELRRREEPAAFPRLYPIALEDRHLLNGVPLVSVDPTQGVTVSAGSAAHDGLADSFQVRRTEVNGTDTLQVHVNDQLAYQAPVAEAPRIRIQGSSDADTLVVDPSAAHIEFHAGQAPPQQADSLQLLAPHLSFARVDFVAAGNDGLIRADQFTVQFTGVETIDDALVAAERSVRIVGTNDVVTLAQQFDRVRLTTEHLTLDVARPTQSFTLDTDESTAAGHDDRDQVRVDDLTASFDLHLTGDAADTLVFAGAIDAAPGANLSGIAGAIRFEGTWHSAGGTARLEAESLELGSSAVIDVSVETSDRLVYRPAEGAGAFGWAVNELTGGSVTLLGDEVRLLGSARIDASGDAGGGQVLVGGDYQGANPLVRNARFTFVDTNVRIAADALTAGDGGRIIVWADEVAVVAGSGGLTARGGAVAGNGGLIETSGKSRLVVGGAADASATHGAAGTWLLDPRNVTIVDGGTATLTAGTLVASADDTTIDASTIVSALSGGTSVSIFTGTTGSQAGNITVNEAIAVTSGGNNVTLRLAAANHVTVNQSITASSGTLSVTLEANSLGSGNNDDPSRGAGDVRVAAAIATNGGNFQSSGVAFDNTGGTITTGDGFVRIDHTGTVTVKSTISGAAANNSIRITSTGNVTIDANVTASGTGTIELSATGVDQTLSITGARTIDTVNQAITLTADHLVLSSTSTIGSDSERVTLQQATASATIAFVNNHNTETAGRLTLDDNDLNALDNRTGVTVIGRSDGGAIAVNDDTDVTTDSATLHLKSGGGISGTGDLVSASLALTAGATIDVDTNVGNLAATLASSVGGQLLKVAEVAAGTQLTVTTVDGLVGLTTTGVGGSINVDVANGTLTISQQVQATGSGSDVKLDANGAGDNDDVVLNANVEAPDQVDIRASRDITQAADDDFVIAPNAVLVAGRDIGKGSGAAAIDTRVTTLAARAGDAMIGDVWVQEDAAGGALTIGSLESQFTTVGRLDGVSIGSGATDGGVDIRTESGSITVSRAVTAKGEHDVRLDAVGTTSSVAIQAAVTADNGDIDILADDDVTFTAAGGITTAIGLVRLTADDDATADAGSGGAIAMADGAVVHAGAGRIELRADENITLDRLITTSNANTSAAPAVLLSTASGAITEDSDAGVADITATAGRLVIRSKSGIGQTTVIETEVLSFDVTNTNAGASGPVHIRNTNAADVTIVALKTESNSGQSTNFDIEADRALKAITFSQSGGGDLTISDGVSGVTTVVSSGAAGLNGGTIHLASTAQLIVSDGISTSTGTGGVLYGRGDLQLLASPTIGRGNVLLSGDNTANADLVVTSAVSATSIVLSAPRDVIVQATISATATDGDVLLTGDANNDGEGGVWVQAAGLVSAARDVTLQGADVAHTRATGDAALTSPSVSVRTVDADEVLDGVRIDVGGTATDDQVLAGRNILLRDALTAGTVASAASIRDNSSAAGERLVTVIEGVVRSSSTGTINVHSEEDIRLGSTLATAGGTITLHDDVRLSASATLSTNTTTALATSGGTPNTALGGDLVFVHGAPIDSEAGENNSLRLAAGAGDIEFEDNLGASQALGSFTILDANRVTFGSADTGTGGGTGPVTTISTTGAIDLGSNAAIAGGIVFNAGTSGPALLSITTTDDTVRLNGAVTIRSHLDINTGAGAGDIRFESTVDGDGLRADRLTLTAGTGAVVMAGNAGGSVALDRFRVVSAASASLKNVTTRAAAVTDTIDVNATAITLDGRLATDGSGVGVNTGGIRLTGAVTLAGHATLDTNDGGTGNSDGSITITGSLTSNPLHSFGATFESGAGTVDLDSAPITGLNFLRVVSSQTVRLDAVTVGSGSANASAAGVAIDLDTGTSGTITLEADLRTDSQSGTGDGGDLVVRGTGTLQLTTNVTFDSDVSGVFADGDVTIETPIAGDGVSDRSLTITAGGGTIRLEETVGTVPGANSTIANLTLTGATVTLLGEVNVDGNATVTSTASTLTIDAPLTADADVVLDAVGASSDLVLNATVTAGDDAHFRAGRDILQAANDDFVVADTLALAAGRRIGAAGAGAIDVRINTLGAVAGTAAGDGDVFVNQDAAGTLLIGSANNLLGGAPVDGVSIGAGATNGSIRVSTEADGLTVDRNVTAKGSGVIELTAGGTNHTFTLNANRTLDTANQSITITADHQVFQNSATIGSGSDRVVLQQATAAATIEFVATHGGETPGRLQLADADLNALGNTTGTTVIGRTDGGAITVTANLDVTADSSALHLKSGGTISGGGELIATNLAFTGADSIDVNTRAGTLAATIATTAAGKSIKVEETAAGGDLTIGTVDGVVGVTTTGTGGSIDIDVADGHFTVDQQVRATGAGSDVLLDSNGTSSNDDIVLNANVEAVDQVELRSARDILQAATDDFVIGANVVLVAGRNIGAVAAGPTPPAPVDLRAGTLAARAGSSASGSLLVNEDAGGGSLTIGSRASVLTGTTITGATIGAGAINGSVEVRTEAGTLTLANAVSAKGTGTVLLDAGGGVSNLAINAAVTSVSGAIDVFSDDDVTFGATGSITSTSGNVRVVADDDATADAGSGGAIVMTDGAVVNAGLGTIDFDADEDITLGRLVTTSPANTSASPALSLTTISGGVIDGGDTGGADLEAATGRLVIRSKAGVGHSGLNPLETAVRSVDVINANAGVAGGVHLRNTSATDVTIVALKTEFDSGVSADLHIDHDLALKAITFGQSGTGRLLVNDGTGGTTTVVSSGNPSVAGGTIHLVSGASLVVDDTISTVSGSGGALYANGAVQIRAAPTLGRGNVLLVGAATPNTDLVIDVDQLSASSFSLSAPRDIIVRAMLRTTAADADIRLVADSDSSGEGGVWIQAGGFVDSARDVYLQGSDVAHTRAAGDAPLVTQSVDVLTVTGAEVLDAVRIDADATATTDQVRAARNVDIRDTVSIGSVLSALITDNTTVAVPPLVTVVEGVVRSTGAGTVDLRSGGQIRLASTLASNGGDLTFHDAVVLSGPANVTSAGGDITFRREATVDSEFGEHNALTLSAGAGDVTFNNNIGAIRSLGAFTITDAAHVTFGGGDTAVLGGAGPVPVIQSDAAIDIGSASAISGGIVFNAGTTVGAAVVVTTTGDNVRLNGPVTLRSDVSISTGAGAGDIAFTDDIDGDGARRSRLTLTAGTGAVSIGGNAGSLTPLDLFRVVSAASASLHDVTTRGTGLANTLDVTATTITLDGTLATNGAGLNANSGGLRLNGAVVLTGHGEFLTDDGGTTNADGAITLLGTVTSGTANAFGATFASGSATLDLTATTLSALNFLRIDDSQTVRLGSVTVADGSANPTAAGVAIDIDTGTAGTVTLDGNLRSDALSGTGNGGDIRVRGSSTLQLSRNVTIDSDVSGAFTDGDITIEASVVGTGGVDRSLTILAGGGALRLERPLGSSPGTDSSLAAVTLSGGTVTLLDTLNADGNVTLAGSSAVEFGLASRVDARGHAIALKTLDIRVPIVPGPVPVGALAAETLFRSAGGSIRFQGPTGAEAVVFGSVLPTAGTLIVPDLVLAQIHRDIANVIVGAGEGQTGRVSVVSALPGGVEHVLPFAGLTLDLDPIAGQAQVSTDIELLGLGRTFVIRGSGATTTWLAGSRVRTTSGDLSLDGHQVLANGHTLELNADRTGAAASGGDIRIGGDVLSDGGGNEHLTLAAVDGHVTLGDTTATRVGRSLTQPLGHVLVTTTGDLTVNATVFASSFVKAGLGGDVLFASPVTLNGLSPTLLGASLGLEADSVTFGNGASVTILAGGGDVAFFGTGAGGITLGTGLIDQRGALGSGLSIDANFTSANLSGDVRTNAGEIAILSPLVIGRSLTLATDAPTATGAAISFGSTVTSATGAESLTLRAGSSGDVLGSTTDFGSVVRPLAGLFVETARHVSVKNVTSNAGLQVTAQSIAALGAVSSSGAAVSLTATGTNAGGVNSIELLAVDTHGHDLTLTAFEDIVLAGGDDSVRSTPGGGVLTIRGTTVARPLELGAGGLSGVFLSETSLKAIGPGFTGGITFGRTGQTGTIQVGSPAHSYDQNVTFLASGGASVVVLAPIDTTEDNADGREIRFVGGPASVFDVRSNLTTDGGAIVLSGGTLLPSTAGITVFDSGGGDESAVVGGRIDLSELASISGAGGTLHLFSGGSSQGGEVRLGPVSGLAELAIDATALTFAGDVFVPFAVTMPGRLMILADDVAVSAPVNAGLGVAVQASGTIDGTSSLGGAEVRLTAGRGIGTTGPLALASPLLSVANVGSGDVRLVNSTAGPALVTGLSAANGGSIEFEQRGGGTVTFQSVSTQSARFTTAGDADIALRNSAGSLVVDGLIRAGDAGNISLDARVDLLLTGNAVVETVGSHAIIRGSAGQFVLRSAGATIHAGSGNAATEAILDVPAAPISLTPLAVNGRNIDQFGNASVDVTMPGVGRSFLVEMDWGDGSLRTATDQTTLDGGDTHRFQHTYLGNPSANPSADIRVTASVFPDAVGRQVLGIPEGRIRFAELGGAVDIFELVLVQNLTTPLGGLGSSVTHLGVVTFETEVVNLERAATPTVLAPPAQPQTTPVPFSAPAEPTAAMQPRHYVLRVVVPISETGQVREGENKLLPDDVLDNLETLFDGLEDDRYRIYLVLEDGSAMLVKDLTLRNHRAVETETEESDLPRRRWRLDAPRTADTPAPPASTTESTGASGDSTTESPAGPAEFDLNSPTNVLPESVPAESVRPDQAHAPRGRHAELALTLATAAATERSWPGRVRAALAEFADRSLRRGARRSRS